MRCADNAVERIYGESQHELNCMVTLIVGTNELPSVFRLPEAAVIKCSL